MLSEISIYLSLSLSTLRFSAVSFALYLAPPSGSRSPPGSFSLCTPNRSPAICHMGVARIFFQGGEHFSKIKKDFLRKLRKMQYFRIWNFRKFSENFLRKSGKMHYFSIFFKKFNKACINFLCVWTKNTICCKFWENFLENFLKKIAKNGLF